MISRLFVVAQFVLLVILLVPVQRHGSLAAALVAVACGLAWLVWTWTTNRPGNFNVRPDTKPGARLATGGHYRLVRHPMYFGVLVTCAGCVVIWPVWWKLATWLAAVVLLVLKARREEIGLTSQFPEYDAYRRNRRFLVPWLW